MKQSTLLFWKLYFLPLAFLLTFSLAAPKSAVAAGQEYLFVGGYYNMSPYQYSSIDPLLGDVSQVFGYQVTWLQDQGEFYFDDTRYRYGAHYYRVEGGSGSFMLNDGYAAVAEILYGDLKKVVQKRPFWEKLWYRAGVRVGYYRWIVLGSGTTNLNDAGLSLSLYLSLGLGRLGSLELSQRSLLSGATNASTMSNTYLTYVYDFKL